MNDYHEPTNELSNEDRNFVRALTSLKEEIEAINWYQQRVAVCDDEELKAVLAHNRDEEIEHACMALEWLRRHMPGWEHEMKTILFREGDIAVHAEEEDGDKGSEDLGIGGLKKST